MATKYVTDEVRKQIGTAGEIRTYEVERGAIRRFAEAIGDPNPLFNDEREARKTRFGGMIAPPTFCRSMGSPIPEIELPGMGKEFRGLDGGSDWEYFHPIACRRSNQRADQPGRSARVRRPPRRDGVHHHGDDLHQSVRRSVRDAALDRDSLLVRDRQQGRGYYDGEAALF